MKMAKKKAVPRQRSSESSGVSDTSEASTSSDMPPPANNRRSRGSPKKTPRKNLASNRMELMRKIISPESDNNNVIAKLKQASGRKTENVPEIADSIEMESEPQPRKKLKRNADDTEVQKYDDNRSMTDTDVLPSTSRSTEEVTSSESKRRKTEINKQSLTIRKDKTAQSKLKIKSVDPSDLINSETVNVTTLPRASKRKGNEETCSQGDQTSTTEDDNIDMLQKRPNETPQMFQMRLSIMKKRMAKESKNTKRNKKKVEDSTTKPCTITQTTVGNIEKVAVPETIVHKQEISTEKGLNETQNMAKIRHSLSQKRMKSDIKPAETLPKCDKVAEKTAVKIETIMNDKTSYETPHMAQLRLSLAEKRMSVEKLKAHRRKTEVFPATASIPSDTSTPDTIKASSSVPDTTKPSTSRRSRAVPSTPVASMPVPSMPVASMPVPSMPVASTPVTRKPVAKTPVETARTPVETVSESRASKQNDLFFNEEQATTPKPTNETPAMQKLRQSIAEKRKSVGISLEKKKIDCESTPKRIRNDISLQQSNKNEINVGFITPVQSRSERNTVQEIQNNSQSDAVVAEIIKSRSHKKPTGSANKRLARLRQWLAQGEEVGGEEQVSDVGTSPPQEEMEWQDIAQQIMEVRDEGPTSSSEYSSQLDEPRDSSPAVQFDNPHKRLLAVVDTNVFISNLGSLQHIVAAYSDKGGDRQVSLPILVVAWRVLLELDELKSRAGVARPARQAGAFLRQHLQKHPLLQGQTLEQASDQIYPCLSADDEILNCCLQLSKAGHRVVLLSNDNNLCCKVTVNGVRACSVPDLMKDIETSPTTAAPTPPHRHTTPANKVLKARRQLMDKKKAHIANSTTSPQNGPNTHNFLNTRSPENVQNVRFKSPENVKFPGKPSPASNVSLHSVNTRNSGTEIHQKNVSFHPSLGSNYSSSSQNSVFASQANALFDEQASKLTQSGSTVLSSSLRVQDQNKEHMNNFQDVLLPVLTHLLELYSRRQFGEGHVSPALSLEQAIRNVLQHWSEMPVQPLSAELHRAVEEVRLVWAVCSQGGQCSSFHVSRARLVAEELSQAVHRVKLAAEQLLPAFEVVWTFFSDYSSRLSANECSIQHEVHTQLARVLEALSRVLSSNDVLGLRSLHEVLRCTLDGVGRAEVPLALDSMQTFCNNNRHLLEEARNKFSQLAAALPA